MIILWAALVSLQDDAPARPDSEFAPLLKVESKIDWMGLGFEEALEQGRKTGKLVLVHLWAHW
jgi:hypothetical protein